MNVSTHTTMSNLESEPGASMGDVSAMTRSQTSMNPGGSSATLSMRAKAARKRKVNAQHNSNFRAGYVPVEEEALHRAGIRGRKRYFLYCFVVVLMITAVLNTLVTAWLLYILGLSLQGMTSIELTSVAGRDFLRVLADARIISMSFSDAGQLGARYNSTLVLESKGSVLQLDSSSTGGGSSIRLEGRNITVTTDQFAVSVNDNDWVLANLASLTAHRAIINLSVDNVTAKLIQPIEGRDGVCIESEQQSVHISGAQGVDILSNKTMELSSTNVFINAQMSVSMDARHGMYFTKLLNVTSGPINSNNLFTYKVCVCSSGQMFAGTSCDIDPQLTSICEETA
ncbi:hypothetical protein BsWGS_27435 [Bradybaena similaris]